MAFLGGGKPGSSPLLHHSFSPTQKCLTKSCRALSAIVLCNGAPSGHQVILSQTIRVYQFHTKLRQTSKTRQSPMHHESLTHIAHHFAFSKTTLSQHIMYSTHLTGQQWKSGCSCKMFYCKGLFILFILILNRNISISMFLCLFQVFFTVMPQKRLSSAQ